MSSSQPAAATTLPGVSASLLPALDEVAADATALLASGVSGLARLDEARAAAANLVELLPTRPASDVLHRLDVAVAEGVRDLADDLATEASVPPHLWSWAGRVGSDRSVPGAPGHPGLAPARALDEVMHRWSRRSHAAARGTTDRASWLAAVVPVLKRMAEEAPLVAESMLRMRQLSKPPGAEVDDGFVGLAVPDPARAGRMLVARLRVLLDAPVDDPIDLFVPASFRPPLEVAPTLLQSVDVGSFAGTARKALCRAVEPPPGLHLNAGTFDFGSLAEPVWFVRPYGLIRDSLARIHEVGHTATAIALREHYGRSSAHLPEVLAETIAYAFEWLVLADPRHDLPGGEAEAVRMCAGSALGAAFAAGLAAAEARFGQRDCDGELVTDAWREACIALDLVPDPEVPAWLLVPRVGGPTDTSRLHLVGQLAALGARHSGEDAATVLDTLVAASADRRSMHDTLRRYLDHVPAEPAGDSARSRVAGIGVLPSDREIAARVPGSADASALFLSGSVIAGWGHANSDIDVYACFSDADALTKALEGVDIQREPDSGAPVVAFYAGDRRWDVEYVLETSVAELIARVTAVVDFSGVRLSYGDIDLLHRIRIGRPVGGGTKLAEWQAAITASSLTDILTSRYLGMSDGMVDDALGLLEVGDIETAAYCARMAFESLADALLAADGRSCPSAKWRIRQLQEAAAGPLTAREYLEVVEMRGYDGRAWVENTIDRIRELTLEL
jgi:hypothetical protein